MEKRFDDLNIRALALADDELTHIAETEQLPPEETVRMIARTLKKADIPAEKSGQKPLRGKAPARRRIRMIGGLLAAAIACTAMGIGVSGWLNYNKPLMENYFGLEGEARLAAMDLPEQESVISESGVRITPEAFLWDDHRAVALVTFESADEAHPINWMKLLHGDPDHVLYYNCSVLNENGDEMGTEAHPFTGYGSVVPSGMSIAWAKSKYCVTAEIEFRVEEGFPGGDLMLQFRNEKYGEIHVPVQAGEKLPVKHLETAAGREMQLSPIGFWAEGITDTAEDSAWWELTLHRADGTERAVHLDKLAGYEEETPEGYMGYETAKVYEVTDGMTYDCDNPASYTAFVDVDDITAIDWTEYRFEAMPEGESAGDSAEDAPAETAAADEPAA